MTSPTHCPTEPPATEPLVDARRRSVLDHLHRLEGPVSLEELAAAVAEDAPGIDGRRLRLALHHTHLPKLEAAGYLAYDWRRRRVSPIPRHRR